ncbi:MAG: hypothetical protein GY870_07195, partial [archaeon]|nr:hypothetical protein [archaeon]
MKTKRIMGLCISFLLILCDTAVCDQTLVAAKITTPLPLIDGLDTDAIWEKINGIVTHSNQADIDIKMKAVHNGTMIFFLVKFPDKNESRT